MLSKLWPQNAVSAPGSPQGDALNKQPQTSSASPWLLLYLPVLPVVVGAGCGSRLAPTPPWTFPAMESQGISSLAPRASCNVCTCLPRAAAPAGWVGCLLFSLIFFFSFSPPLKPELLIFFPRQVQVEMEVEQQEGGTANPSCRPGARRLGRRESPVKGRG